MSKREVYLTNRYSPPTTFTVNSGNTNNEFQILYPLNSFINKQDISPSLSTTSTLEDIFTNNINKQSFKKQELPEGQIFSPPSIESNSPKITILPEPFFSNQFSPFNISLVPPDLSPSQIDIKTSTEDQQPSKEVKEAGKKEDHLYQPYNKGNKGNKGRPKKNKDI